MIQGLSGQGGAGLEKSTGGLMPKWGAALYSRQAEHEDEWLRARPTDHNDTKRGIKVSRHQAKLSC